MIDDIDRELLVQLQEDSSVSNAVLAKAVGLTVSAVHERVKKLERKGVIKGYTAVVDGDAIGKPIVAFVRLTIGSVDYVQCKQEVVAACQHDPSVLECYGLAGDDDYIIKVRAKNPQDLEATLERIRVSASISKSITSVVMRTFKESQVIVPAE